jgi:hypothetical protein
MRIHQAIVTTACSPMNSTTSMLEYHSGLSDITQSMEAKFINRVKTMRAGPLQFCMVVNASASFASRLKLNLRNHVASALSTTK